MQPIFTTIALLAVTIAATASTASAQNYGHHDHGHYRHGTRVHGDAHGYYHSYNDYHGSHHSTDYLTYPAHPHAHIYATPVYAEPSYVHSGSSEYYCPEATHCPQDQYAPLPSRGHLSDHAYNQAPTLQGRSHAGHDHGNLNHGGSDPLAPQQGMDNGYVPRPSLSPAPGLQQAPRPETYSRSGQSSLDSQRNDAPKPESPIQMDGPPPTLDISPAETGGSHAGHNHS